MSFGTTIAPTASPEQHDSRRHPIHSTRHKLHWQFIPVAGQTFTDSGTQALPLENKPLLTQHHQDSHKGKRGETSCVTEFYVVFELGSFL